MKFRNYVPQDKELQEGKLAPPVLPKFEDPVAAAPPPAENKEVLSFSILLHLFLLFLLLDFHILNLDIWLGSISQHCSKETKLGPAKGCAEEA